MFAVIEEQPIADLNENSSELDGGEKKEVQAQFNEVRFDELFPNSKLAAELEMANDTERKLYNDYTDAYLKLNEIVQKIDDTFGDKLSILLDEIVQVENVNKEEVMKIKNMNVSLLTINSENNGFK